MLVDSHAVFLLGSKSPRTLVPATVLPTAAGGEGNSAVRLWGKVCSALGIATVLWTCHFISLCSSSSSTECVCK